MISKVYAQRQVETNARTTYADSVQAVCIGQPIKPFINKYVFVMIVKSQYTRC